MYWEEEEETNYRGEVAEAGPVEEEKQVRVVEEEKQVRRGGGGEALW